MKKAQKKVVAAKNNCAQHALHAAAGKPALAFAMFCLFCLAANGPFDCLRRRPASLAASCRQIGPLHVTRNVVCNKSNRMKLIAVAEEKRKSAARKWPHRAAKKE